MSFWKWSCVVLHASSNWHLKNASSLKGHGAKGNFTSSNFWKTGTKIWMQFPNFFFHIDIHVYRSLTKKLNEELQVILCMCVCVCVQFCFPAKVEWPGLILMVWKISPVSRGFPLLDSHNREANQLNRFCVAPFASAYLVHWLLCNCYYFELLLLRRSTSVSTTHSDYIRDSFAIEVYSYQDVFLLFYK